MIVEVNCNLKSVIVGLNINKIDKLRLSCTKVIHVIATVHNNFIIILGELKIEKF